MHRHLHIASTPHIVEASYNLETSQRQVYCFTALNIALYKLVMVITLI